jgi:hypothetical protein
MRKSLIALAMGALLCGAPLAFAKVSSLEGANLGEHWYGPERTLDGLKGHVVLWENWGYN